MANTLVLEAKLKANQDKLEGFKQSLETNSDPRVLSSLQQAIVRTERIINNFQANIAAAQQASIIKAQNKLPKLHARVRFLKQKAKMMNDQANVLELEIEALESHTVTP